MASKEAPAPAPSAGGGGGSKLPLLLGLVNVLALLAAAGLLYYTRMVFKRPVITESGERARLAKMHASPLPPSIPMTIAFEPLTVNIESTPVAPKADEKSNQLIQGKLHYVTLGFSTRDSRFQAQRRNRRAQAVSHRSSSARFGS